MTVGAELEPAAPAYRLPPAVPGAIAGAWLLAVATEATGRAGIVHHDSLFHSDVPAPLALGLFVVSWQAMTAAMMLPSSLPLVRLFSAATTSVEGRRRAMGAFLGGYAMVWTAFGAVAFVVDQALHQFVDATPWLAERSWLVAGAVIAGAGAFQFSSLKDRCLDECRHPAAYLVRHYRRGTREAFHLGWGHAVFCLGCCWALMLLMFAAGVANLAWMAILTAVTVYEKACRHGRRVTPVVGVVLLCWSALVLAHPAWLPSAVAGIN
jgi:predicted metal-binding membrane protein